MTVRSCTPAFPGDKTTIYHAHQKVAHRADPDVEIERGQPRRVRTGAGAAARLAPDRGAPLLVAVGRAGREEGARWLAAQPPSHESTEHQIQLDDARREGRLDAVLRPLRGVGPRSSSAAWRTAALAVDTRLRDALRVLRAPDGGVPRCRSRDRHSRSTPPDVADAAAYAAEASVLVGIDGIVRAEQRVDCARSPSREPA